jgi:hypothetical protein
MEYIYILVGEHSNDEEGVSRGILEFLEEKM